MARMLGERIKALRETQDLTQSELAQQISASGVSVQNAHISAIECGWRKPSLTLLGSIARALNTTTDYLLELTDHAEQDTTHELEPA